MSEFKILKPAVSGVTCRDPKTGVKLPDEGRAVAMTTFWNRRLADGSVVEVTAAPAPAPAASKNPKTAAKED